MGPLKVVAHYFDGRIVKGTTCTFHVNGDPFTLLPTDGGSCATATEIHVEDLKAVFFVKTYQGNPEYKDRREFLPGDVASGRKMKVTFKDGDVITGSAMQYNARSLGFFLFPCDPNSNNEKIFVVNTAVVSADYL